MIILKSAKVRKKLQTPTFPKKSDLLSYNITIELRCTSHINLIDTNVFW